MWEYMKVPEDSREKVKNLLKDANENGVKICEAQNPKRNAARIARRKSIHPSYGYLV